MEKGCRIRPHGLIELIAVDKDIHKTNDNKSVVYMCSRNLKFSVCLSAESS